MVGKHFSGSLEEIREALKEAKKERQFVALLGDNKNVLGFGKVDEVNCATVELEFDFRDFSSRVAAIPGISSAASNLITSTNSLQSNSLEVEATVNLKCVCSVVSGDPVLLFIIGLFLGYVTIPGDD